jgi:hypothetical protein
MDDKQPVKKNVFQTLNTTTFGIRSTTVVVSFVSLLHLLPFLRSARRRFCVFCSGCIATGSSLKGGHHYVRNL